MKVSIQSISGYSIAACINIGICRYLGSHLAGNNQNALLRMLEDFVFELIVHDRSMFVY